MLIDILLTISSAIMLILAFPPVNFEFLAWIGMVPLFFALSGRNTGSRLVPAEGGRRQGSKGGIIAAAKPMRSYFLLGFLWGSVFFLGTIYWVVNSMVNYGGLSFFTGILILLMLASFLSLFLSLFGFGAAKFLLSETNPLLKILSVASLWVALEYIRANMPLGGFPWVLLGYSQFSFLPLIQITDIFGVYGVSFLIVMVNVFVFLAIQGQVPRVKDQGLKISGIVVPIVFISVLIYGFCRIAETDKAVAAWKPLKIGIAQGNIDQGKKWDKAFERETVEIYKGLTRNLARQGARFIVWPESALPFFLQSDKEFGPEIFLAAKQNNVHLLTGADTYGPGFGGEIKYYNSALLLSPKEEIIGKYDKIHLVPFGEYVPLKTYLPFIHKLVVGVGDFSSGKFLRPLEFSGNSFGVLICFESIFPELSRGFVKEGAGFLVNMTNDAWFGKSSAPYQHFSQAVFRAVENKVFLVRAANTGISGIIDPVGRVRFKSGIFTTQGMVEDIKVRDAGSLTFYARYGDMFAIGCMVLAVGCGLIAMRKRNK